MSNAIVTRDQFDKMENIDVKLGILFDTSMKTQEMLKGKRLDAKAIGGGFIGGFVAVIAKMFVWR